MIRRVLEHGIAPDDAAVVVDAREPSSPPRGNRRTGSGLLVDRRVEGGDHVRDRDERVRRRGKAVLEVTVRRSPSRMRRVADADAGRGEARSVPGVGPAPATVSGTPLASITSLFRAKIIPLTLAAPNGEHQGLVDHHHICRDRSFADDPGGVGRRLACRRPTEKRGYRGSRYRRGPYDLRGLISILLHCLEGRWSESLIAKYSYVLSSVRQIGAELVMGKSLNNATC